MVSDEHVGRQFLHLYHRTSPENAAKILKEGFRSHPDTPGALYFSDKARPPEGSHTWEYGESVVEAKVPAKSAHVDDDFGDEKHYRVDEGSEKVVRAWSDVD